MTGDPIAPAESTISPSAATVESRPWWRKLTATARPRETITRSTVAPVTTSRVGRWRTGLRKASAALQRRPRRWVTWYSPAPSWRGPLKSGLAGMPASMAPSTNRRDRGEGSMRSSTRISPPTACQGPGPRLLSSTSRNAANAASQPHPRPPSSSHPS